MVLEACLESRGDPAGYAVATEMIALTNDAVPLYRGSTSTTTMVVGSTTTTLDGGVIFRIGTDILRLLPQKLPFRRNMR